MNKIMIFYPHIIEYGGIERNIIALSIAIRNQGKIPTLVCYYDNIDMGKLSNGNLEVVILGDSKIPHRKGFLLKNWIKRNKSAISFQPLFFGTKACFYAALAKCSDYALHYTDPPSLLSLAQINFVHRVIGYPRQTWKAKIMKSGINRASTLITMTERNANELKELYGKEFEVIYQGGIPPELVSKSPRFQGERLKIFSICRVNASKNLSWIIDLLYSLKDDKQCLKEFKSINVVIAGTGPDLPNLIEQVDKKGLKEYFEFPGFLSSTQVEQHYIVADLFLVPGKQGYGLPVLEALYRHIPVVLNIESRVSEILESNPWVGISADNSESFIQTTKTHINTLLRKYPKSDELLSLPTESDWANNIGKRCNWW